MTFAERHSRASSAGPLYEVGLNPYIEVRHNDLLSSTGCFETVHSTEKGAVGRQRALLKVTSRAGGREQNEVGSSGCINAGR